MGGVSASARAPAHGRTPDTPKTKPLTSKICTAKIDGRAICAIKIDRHKICKSKLDGHTMCTMKIDGHKICIRKIDVRCQRSWRHKNAM